MADVVLIVDDDASTRELLSEELRLQGFLPVKAAHGWEALRFLQAGGLANVILLDLMMPVMDGWMFRCEQRANRRIANIPVVVITAADLYRIDELEADAVVRKPIDIDKIVRLIRDVLRQPPPRLLNVH